MKRYITPILLLFACLSFAVPVEALTKAEADKAYLIRIGNGEQHLLQIEEATQVVRLTKNGRRISSKRAIEEIGRNEFLSAMSRCAYHQTASRRTPTEETIEFVVPDSFWK